MQEARVWTSSRNGTLKFSHPPLVTYSCYSDGNFVQMERQLWNEKSGVPPKVACLFRKLPLGPQVPSAFQLVELDIFRQTESAQVQRIHRRCHKQHSKIKSKTAAAHKDKLQVRKTTV